MLVFWDYTHVLVLRPGSLHLMYKFNFGACPQQRYDAGVLFVVASLFRPFWGCHSANPKRETGREVEIGDKPPLT